MVFNYNITGRLKEKIKLLEKRDRLAALRLLKKIQEVASRDIETVEFYKNLKAPMQEYKRVHLGSFVLLFKVEKNRNFILFWDFDHHDNVYKN